MMDIFARIGGLNGLAEGYPTTDQPGGPQLAKQTLQEAAAGRRRAPQKVCDRPHWPPGILPLVRPILSNYPGVLIPWDEVKGTREARIYRQRAVRMSSGSPPVATITVLTDLYKRSQPYLNSEPQSY